MKPLQGLLGTRPFDQLVLGRVVELGILDGDGGMIREGVEVGKLGGAVVFGGCGIEGEHPEDLVPALDGQPEVGHETEFRVLIDVEVVGVGKMVGAEERPAGPGHDARGSPI